MRWLAANTAAIQTETLPENRPTCDGRDVGRERKGPGNAGLGRSVPDGLGPCPLKDLVGDLEGPGAPGRQFGRAQARGVVGHDGVGKRKRRIR